MFNVMSLASSSKGNSYLIETENAKILLDLGISFKKIKDLLNLKGIDINDIDSIFISHEHIDHIRSLKMVLKKIDNVKIYLSQGTFKGIIQNDSDYLALFDMYKDKINIVKAKDEILIKDILITPFNVSHDTNEPLMFSFSSNNKKLSIVTDTGIVTDEIFENIKNSDTLVLESNHEPDILMYGDYPYIIKKRILSDFGHLSNELCGECLKRILDEKKNIKIYLAHLSENNNTPLQAKLTVNNYLEEQGYILNRDYILETLNQKESSKVIEI